MIFRAISAYPLKYFSHGKNALASVTTALPDTA